MKRKILPLFLTFALVFSMMSIFTVTASAVDANVRNCVVLVRSFTEDAVDHKTIFDYSWGSGFFVGVRGQDPQYLITNYHVIENFHQIGAGDLYEYYTDSVLYSGETLFEDKYHDTFVRLRSKIHIHYSSSDFEEGYLVDCDPQKDIALIKLDNPTNKRIALPVQHANDFDTGSSVYVIGYPGIAENVFASATSSFSEKDSTITSGVISNLFTQQGTGVHNIQTDCDIRPGNSGGPMVNEAGAAIGVATWSVNSQDDRINYAISMEEVTPLLNLHSVTYTLFPSTPDPNISTTTVATPDPITTDPEITTTAVTTTVPGSNNDQTGLPLWIWIVIAAAAAVVIIIIVLIIVLAGRNKPAPAPAPAPVPIQPQPPVPPQPSVQPVHPAPPVQPKPVRAVIRSLAPQHQGASVPVTERPVSLGRSKADCAVVYLDNTPGVSGVHCTVSFDPASNMFLLTDVGSSYGTFLQTGEKLNKGVAYRLRSGDRFYLGEKENMVMVEVE